MTLIPLINTYNKQILTHQNWLELGIRTLAYSLEALLIKPGVDCLMQQSSLADYVGWPHDIWLTTLSTSIQLQSPFDGSRINLDSEAVNALTHHLKPTRVLACQSHHTYMEKTWITDQPLQWALEGRLSADHPTLADPRYREAFSPIAPNCTCPTCNNHFTLAYLHHLWFEVPHLCQRYVAMHHIWFFQNT